MHRSWIRFAILTLALGFAASAGAQAMQTIRGDVAAIDGKTLRLKSASGQETAIALPDNPRVSLRVKARGRTGSPPGWGAARCPSRGSRRT